MGARIKDEVERLTRAGYRDDFRAEDGALVAVASGRRFGTEELEVDEEVRFEGETDPEEEAILLALRSRDGQVRGTWLVPYGPEATEEDAQVLAALKRPAAAGTESRSDTP